MKTCIFYPLALVFALVSCEDFNEPISGPDYGSRGVSGSDYNAALNQQPEPLIPGQFGTAVIDNTAFYQSEPQGDEVADRLLDRGTAMKIVSVGREHVKVELDSGEVGYVPKVMVTSGELKEAAESVGEGMPGSFSNDSRVEVQPLPPEDRLTLPLDERIPEMIDPDAASE